MYLQPNFSLYKKYVSNIVNTKKFDINTGKLESIFKAWYGEKYKLNMKIK